MSNKKGFAPDEWFGIIFLVLGLVFFGLIFISCSAAITKQKYEQSQSSKTEFEAIKELNVFLEMPYIDAADPEFQQAQGKKAVDVIIKKYLDVDFSQGDNFDVFVNNHFSQIFDKFRLAVYDKGIRGAGSWSYQSSNLGYGELVEASVIIATPKDRTSGLLDAVEQDDFKLIEVVLQVYI